MRPLSYYLSFLQSALAEKKEQLKRLKSCEAELDGLQNELNQNQKLAKDPELTSKTWKGTLSNQFEEVREALSFSYKHISHNQLNSVLTSIENKIEEIKAEIQSLESNIAAETARIEREKREEREERAE
ncbi:YwqH-like family protein [Metabacillus arenae]|uniref:DUF5082 family protein n=1 Tax=Metabacillus arenae TaxID=2771434 RepID=A0A926RWZ3_9BACI|nr:DUF5082 family protein [Metabacillus arenae]MBD1380446.1 DUF5082 family protein [Metabacillus arenae]